MAAEQFRPWRRPAMTSLAGSTTFDHGRLVAHLPISLTSDAGSPTTVTAAFALAGPGDVRGLAPGAVRGRAPSPGSDRAESTTVAFVELGDPDLPWRYTPEVNPAGGTGGLRPWLVLVVGTTGTGVAVHGDRARVSGAVLAEHDLSRAAAWAHVHELPDGSSVGRILSPVGLSAGTQYTAALVPTFIVEGQSPTLAWGQDAGDRDLPCYDSWSFRTKANPDDFQRIARRLVPMSDAELAQLDAQGFGVARVSAGPAGTQTLVLGGALTRPTPPTPTALGRAVGAEVSRRARLPWRAGHPWVLGLPRYDDPWAPLPGTEPRPRDLTGWRGQLHRDPRHRGVAGLGAWAAVAWQDRISDGARAQAGAVATAAGRVRHLGLGLHTTRSLWDRRVPQDDPVAALSVLSPMLGRLPTAAGTVLEALDRRTPDLVPALFSSAAKRMLRPRSAIARASQDGATGLATLIGVAATTCPDPPRPPAGQEGVVDALATDPEGVTGRFREFPNDLLHQAAEQIARSDDEHGGHPGERPDDHIEEMVGALTEGADAVVDRMLRSRPHVACRPIEVDRTATSVVAGIDPHLDPVVVDRVLDPFTGLREPRLAPPDLALELDIPFWSFLRDHAPDWLLPGADEVIDDRVLALATNPAFVDAFLIGANQQALGELRRRNIPVITGWTPLRRFWQRISDDGTKPSDLDVLSVLDPALLPRWEEGSALGHASHQRGTTGPMLVVLLSTALFREYPHTQVYLARAVTEDDRWTTLPDVQDAGVREDPVLTGNLDPDLVFFGFPLPPEAIEDHWLVLEEPPPGYRFQPPTNAQRSIEDAAAYAEATLYEPVRAFFGNLG